MDLNQVNIIGNVSSSVDTKTTQSGSVYSKFSIATNYSYKDTKEVEFSNIVCFGKLAEIARDYVQRGKKIYICGRLKTTSWESEDGKKNYRTEIIANNIILLSPKSENSETKIEDTEVRIEDLPF